MSLDVFYKSVELVISFRSFGKMPSPSGWRCMLQWHVLKGGLHVLCSSTTVAMHNCRAPGSYSDMWSVSKKFDYEDLNCEERRLLYRTLEQMLYPKFRGRSVSVYAIINKEGKEEEGRRRRMGADVAPKTSGDRCT